MKTKTIDLSDTIVFSNSVASYATCFPVYMIHIFYIVPHQCFISLTGKYISHTYYAMGQIVCVAYRLVSNLQVLQCLKLHEYVRTSLEHINYAEYNERTPCLLNLYDVIGNEFQIYLVLWSVM